MKAEDLKEGFKMIPEEVKKALYKKAFGTQPVFVRWIERYEDDIMIRVFAARFDKKNNFQITEVERTVPGLEYGVQKNCYLTAMSGWKFVFERKSKASRSWYGYNYYYFREEDFDVWSVEKPIPEYYGEVLNLVELFKIEKYKYCGYSGRQGLREYLEYYKKDSSVEFFGKLGLKYQAMLGKRAKKDKAFRKFIAQNVDDVNKYKYKVTEYAFKYKTSFEDAYSELEKKRAIDNDFRGFAKVNYKYDREKIRNWWDASKQTNGTFDKSYKAGCWKNGYKSTLGWASYKDYWNACVELGLDMRDTKNSMPYDFRRMHDVRINELASKKAALEERKRKDFDGCLKQIAEKWQQNFSNDEYMMVIPKSKADFENESKCLHHCVARMGYDQRMVDGLIIIAFVRDVKKSEEPLYTVEYNLKDKKVVQMHGINNSGLPEDAEKFVYSWADSIRGLQNVKKKNRRQRAC